MIKVGASHALFPGNYFKFKMALPFFMSFLLLVITIACSGKVVAISINSPMGSPILICCGQLYHCSLVI